ncbi:MAG: hypothetical protein ACI8XO_000389 [Verrucomicrobiales bacterium]|jgi:hypothetical protein
MRVSKFLIALVFLVCRSLCPAADEEITTSYYTIKIADPGFRIGVTAGEKVVLPPHATSGLSFLGSPVTKSEKLSQAAQTTTYRLTNGNAQTAMVKIVATDHTIELLVRLENDLSGPIKVRVGSPGAAYGLGDRGSYGSNANLGKVQKSYAIGHDGHRHRWLSSFLVFPERGVAGACFDRRGGSVGIGPKFYEMGNASASVQRFYFYVGSMEEIYAAYRATRIAEGYPGVAPKMDGFELGWESWALLKWNTSDETCRKAIRGFLDRGYKIRWAVTGSGFWEKGQTTVGFGRFDLTKFPESEAPLPPNLGDWMAERKIRWLIGQRTNFVKLGGPFQPTKRGQSGATIYKTSPNSQEGLDKGYFLKGVSGKAVEKSSTTYPIASCYLLDGNVPGAASWFKELYDQWGVDGVKEDTMMATPDHTIYNTPMRAISEGGDLVMARCGAYSSPGTLTRVNDTSGPSSMTLRCPINYLQYAASAAPNVYSDTAGFSSVSNVKATLRHSWLLALTAGMAVSDSPWNRKWSVKNEAIFKKVADLHHELGPYMHSAAVDSHLTGYPHTMTPLPIAFPTDAATYDLASKSKQQFEWMIGPSLLAAPLLHANYGKSNRMDIYLPAGTWIDFETGKAYSGPTTLKNFDMPLTKTPLFVGGKGVFVSRQNETSRLEAVVLPIATGGSIYKFTFPDGKSTCTVVNNNRAWNAKTLSITDTTNGKSIPFSSDPATGAIRFPIAPDGRYELAGGE